MNTYHPAPPPTELSDPERDPAYDWHGPDYQARLHLFQHQMSRGYARAAQRRQERIVGFVIVVLVGIMIGLVLSAWLVAK